MLKKPCWTLLIRAVIADLANQSKEIRLMNTEIQKSLSSMELLTAWDDVAPDPRLVISNFPDLRGDKAR